MEKISLKLREFYSLEAELNGLVNQETKEIVTKGLLNEKIKLTTKYWLSDLNKKILAEKESVEKLKEELIKKHGDTDETGNIGISKYINIVKNEAGEVVSGELSPKYIEFENEFLTLLEEERELEHHAFKLEEFDNVETDGNYPTLFKLIKIS
jgi:hypothetical protein